MSPRKAPEVIEVEVEEGGRWLVESRSYAPGAFWNVTYALHPYDDVRAFGGRFRLRYEMRCPCPHGRKQVERPLPERAPCAHLEAVVRFQVAKQARPVMPANVSALVD